MNRRVVLVSAIYLILFLPKALFFESYTSKLYLKANLIPENRQLLENSYKWIQNLGITSTTRKCKWLKSCMLYFHNSVSSLNITSAAILVSGDVYPNPGPVVDSTDKPKPKCPAVKCPKCLKAVQRNHKPLQCIKCFDLIHACCAGLNASICKSIPVNQPGNWTCSNCILSELFFYNVKDLITLDSSLIEENFGTTSIDLDPHLDELTTRQRQLSFMHLNTQCMTSTFDELLLVIQRYGFDMVTLSETWLKDNPELLNHVSIPGYVNEFRNRDKIQGGGVGAYIKESVKYKRRKDIESRYPELEHLWLEIQGRNKHSHLLMGTIYRSTRILDTQQWLLKFESMLSDLMTTWDGLLIISGDLNINMLKPSDPLTKKYTDLLYTFNLNQQG